MSVPGQQPPRLHIVGRQNHGKTTLIVELIEALCHRGLRVGTIKHTSHLHELDTPGKDSHRHRESGAAPVAVVSGEVTAIYLPNLDPQQPYDRLAPMFADCDLVLVEGHLHGPGPFVEVWRDVPGTAPLATERSDITLVISDDSPQVSTPVCSRWDLTALQRILMHYATTGAMLPLVSLRGLIDPAGPSPARPDKTRASQPHSPASR